MSPHLRVVLLLCAYLTGALGATLYVSPSGSNSGTGTLDKPFNSIQAAVDAATAPSTIYLRGGTYSPTTNIQIKKSGSAGQPFVVSAYQSEKVVIDGEALPGTPAALNADLPNAQRGIFHIEKANFWEFYNIEFKNGPYGVYHRDSSNNYYKSIITRDNYETGFQIQGASSNNTVLYLDSYGNRDPRKNGESADGFALKEGSGTGNVLNGARLWNNVDDGLDLWEFKSAVTITNTISWGNGFNRWGFSDFAGDGNGFKLGGGDAADIGPANHVVTNCIAFLNAATGFTDNSQPGNFKLSRNTAWNNNKDGFKMATAVSTLSGNIAALNKASQASLTGSQTSSGNSWDSSTTWSNSSFKSVDTSLVTGSRISNGKIAVSNFLLPASGASIGATTTW